MTEEFEMNEDCVIDSPSDCILDGKITSIEKTTWKENLKDRPEALAKFNNQEQEILVVGWEAVWGKQGNMALTGNTKFPYFDKPMDRSKLGKFLKKYHKLAVGTEVKVMYGSDGFGDIVVK